MLRRMVVRLAFLAFAVLATLRPAFAGKKSYVGQRVPSGQQVSMVEIDHRVWDRLLKKYVDQNGLVDYRSWKATGTDLTALDSYLRTLSSANPSARASRVAQFAFWINAYNAVTMRGMLNEYPTSSIRNHTAKVVGYNIWHDLLLVVGDKAFSLDQIEHKILRPMKEPRIHFAIVCASTGCPRLLNEAYVPEQLEEQLETNSRDFFARKQNFRFDEQRKTIHLSELLSWFGEDFVPNQAAQLRTISKWLPTESARRHARENAARVKFLDYDWSINEQKAKS